MENRVGNCGGCPGYTDLTKSPHANAVKFIVRHIEKLDFDRRDVSVGWVEDSLMEFSRFDHQSFAFRYPHDKS
jgi:hypothetical protein